MPRFESLSEEMTRRIESDRQHGTSPKVFCPNTSVIRRAASPRDAGIEGCYYNIMGLPVHRTAQLLREFT